MNLTSGSVFVDSVGFCSFPLWYGTETLRYFVSVGRNLNRVSVVPRLRLPGSTAGPNLPYVTLPLFRLPLSSVFSYVYGTGYGLRLRNVLTFRPFSVGPVVLGSVG